VELTDASEKIRDATDAQTQNVNEKTSTLSSENHATLLLDSNETPETPDSQVLDRVADACYFDATSGQNLATFATSAETDAQTSDDNVIKLGAIATELIHCATPADVETLYAVHATEAIEAAKEMLGDEERLTFEAILSQCASKSTDVVEVAQSPTPNASTNKEASPTTTVGKLFRYIGTLTHYLKDAEGNPILDAAGKVLALTKDSELILEDVGGAVNDEYANVRPTAVDCRPLGLRRSQLEEVNVNE
jgi:hypothetical protein